MQSSLQTSNRKRGKGKRRKYEPYATAASYLRLAAETYSPFCRSPFKRQRASGRTKATNFLPRCLPRSLLHAGKRARVIYTRASGFAEPHFERRRRGVFPGLRARMQSTSKLYISPIIFHFFRLSAPPQNSSDPGGGKSTPCFTWQDEGARTYDVLFETADKIMNFAKTL